MKTIWVHAHEHSPGEAGSAFFNWYRTEDAARAAFHAALVNLGDNPDDAHFVFPVEVEDHLTDEQVTNFIDVEDALSLAASATTRRVGANVLAYWQASKFQMGTATEPHRTEN